MTYSPATEAAATLGRLLTALNLSESPRDRRIQGSLKAAQRALQQPAARELDGLAADLCSERMEGLAATVGKAEALKAVQRFYGRQQ